MLDILRKDYKNKVPEHAALFEHKLAGVVKQHRGAIIDKSFMPDSID